MKLNKKSENKNQSSLDNIDYSSLYEAKDLENNVNPRFDDLNETPKEVEDYSDDYNDDYSLDDNYISDDYDSFDNEFSNDKKSPFLFFQERKKEILIAVIVLFVFIIGLFFFLNGNKIKTISLEVPNVAYVGEETAIKSIVTGKDDINSVKHILSFLDNPDAEILEEEKTGKEVDFSFIANSSGKIKVKVNTSLGSSKKAKESKEIIICSRLNKENINVNQVTIGLGQNQAFLLNLGPTDACFTGVNFAIRDENIATVNNRVITGVAKGSTVLIISDKNETIEIPLVVTGMEEIIALKDIGFAKKDISIEEGKTQNLVVNFNPTNATNKNLTYTSSNTGIVQVSATGEIKAIKVGKATITAVSEDGNFKAETVVTVTKATGSTTPSNAPKVNTASLSSNNKLNTAYAKSGDTVTLKVVFSENVTKPTITIAGKTATVSGNNRNYTAVITVDKNTKDGTVAIEISNYKSSSNIAGKSHTSATGSKVTIDKTAPTCSLAISGTTFTISGSDGNSGIEGYAISKTKVTPSSFSQTKTLAASTNGTYYGYVRDKAGNISNACERSYTAVVKDTTPPNLTSITMNSGYITGSGTVTIRMTSNEALAKAPSVTIKGVAASVTGSGTSWTATISGSRLSDGGVNFSISGYADAAGNVGATRTGVTSGGVATVDRTPPSCNISKSNTGTTGGVTLTVTASDSGSGISNVTGTNGVQVWTNSYTQTGVKTGTYYGYAGDHAGNSTSCSITVTASSTTTWTRTIVSYSCPTPASDYSLSGTGSSRKCSKVYSCSSNTTGYFVTPTNPNFMNCISNTTGGTVNTYICPSGKISSSGSGNRLTCNYNPVSGTPSITTGLSSCSAEEIITRKTTCSSSTVTRYY